MKDWADDVVSTVCVKLERHPSGCQVHLTQTGIPTANKFGHSNVEQTVRQGWEQRVFMGIKHRLGFGAEL